MAPPRGALRGGRVAGALVAAMLGMATVALAADGLLDPGPPAPAKSGFRLAATTGFLHANSREGSAILTAAGMHPGDSTSGSVLITNGDAGPTALTMSQSNLLDAAGPHGGALSSKLDLTVRDRTRGSLVYGGKLAGMPAQALDPLAAGESRTYDFTVTFRDGGIPVSDGSGDNAFKGSSVSAQFNWASSAAPTTPASPSPAPPPPPDSPSPPPASSPSSQGSPGSAPAAGQPQAPLRLTLRATRRQRVMRRRRVVLLARCSAACSLRASAKASVKAGKRKRARRLPAPKRVKRKVSTRLTKLTMKFSKKAMRKLRPAFRRRRRVTLTVTVVATDRLGRRVRATRKIQLRK